MRTALEIWHFDFVQGKDILIVSKFQNTQFIGSIPVKLKPISGVSHLSGVPFFVPVILSSKINQPDY